MGEFKRKVQGGYLYTRKDDAYTLYTFADRNEASKALRTERFAGYRQISGKEAVMMFGLLAVEGYSVRTERYDDNKL